MACTDSNCQCHQGQNGHATTNGSGGTATMTVSATSSSTGDTSYSQTEAVLAEVIQETEAGISITAIEKATQLADSLPGMIPDDSETVGHVTDGVAALQEAEDAYKRAQEAFLAAQNSHQANFQAHQEASDATGHTPEREYTAS